MIALICPALCSSVENDEDTLGEVFISLSDILLGVLLFTVTVLVLLSMLSISTLMVLFIL